MSLSEQSAKKTNVQHTILAVKHDDAFNFGPSAENPAKAWMTKTSTSGSTVDDRVSRDGEGRLDQRSLEHSERKRTAQAIADEKQTQRNELLGRQLLAHVRYACFYILLIIYGVCLLCRKKKQMRTL